MRTSNNVVPLGSISGTDKSVGKSVSPPRKSVSDENWFAEMSRQLFEPKPGLQLMLLSGVDERSCYRYASGEVRPPAHFLRELLRGEQGEAVLRFLMQGSESEWWRRFKRRNHIAAQIEQLDLR